MKKFLIFLTICALFVPMLLAVKPGDCPTYKDDDLGICGILCKNDEACPGAQKCCDTPCKGSRACSNPA